MRVSESKNVAEKLRLVSTNARRSAPNPCRISIFLCIDQLVLYGGARFKDMTG